MKKVYILSYLLALVYSARATYTIVPVTGFNFDVICNGIGAATTSSNNDVDGANYAFVAQNYQLNSTSAAPSQSLPNSGLITSGNTSGLQFQLGNYSGNNTLRLTGTNSGTLTVTTPVPAVNIYVLAVSGSGSCTGNITVTFTDATTQVFNGLSFQDWYGGSGYAIGSVGRINRSNNGLETATNGPRLYETVLALNAANYTKQIASITVARTGSGTSVLNVFAISVSDPCTGTPTGGTASSNVATACIGTPFTLSLTGASTTVGITYQWQSATNASGPWTNIGTVQATSTYTPNATVTSYYRCAVICGNSSSTSYSSSVQVTVPSLMPGGTYTINSASPTGGTNFHSFQDAINAISCGIGGPIVFNVVPGSGPYTEQPVMPQIGNSSAVNTVTFNGNNEILTFTPTSTNNAIFALNGADYVRIRKLTLNVNSVATYGIGIALTNDADNNIIDSCTINVGVTGTTANFTGIAITGTLTSTAGLGSLCDSTTISNNQITGGYYGISVNGSSTTAYIYNTKIINNTVKEFYYAGIYNNYCSGFLVENNDVHRLTRVNPNHYHGVRLNSSTGLKISKNKFHDGFTGTPASPAYTYCIYINLSPGTASQPNEISNNIMYNLNGNSNQYGIYCYSSAFSNFYFNTFIADYTAATSTSPTCGYYQFNSASNNFQNNIIYITRGGTGNKYGLSINSSALASSNRNDIYINASGTTNYIASTSSTANYATLTAWQTASSMDANSMSVDPNFVSPSTGNVSPSNLAMDNIGTPISGIPTDITGYFRNTITPDAGALEFNNCTDPSGLAVSSVTSVSATVSWAITPGVANYQYVVDQSATAPSAAGIVTTATSANVASLTPLTLYYLHVRTDCGAGSVSNWKTIPFTTCLSASITAGGTTTFCTGYSVVLNAPAGTGYSYQWVQNNVAIPGATNASVTATTAGDYKVILTDPTANCIATTILPTTVVVGSPPVSTITPAGAVGLCLYGTDTLVTNQAPGLTYQWSLNGSAITGATNNTYYATSTGSYTVLVSAGIGCSSTTATPTVVSYFTQPTASITATGGVPVICTGGTQTLNAGIVSGYTYQWMSNGSIIPTATTTSYTTATAGAYKLIVTDNHGCSDTSAATNLTIVALPVATTSPSVPTTGCDSVILTAIGSNLTYQWNYNNNAVAGATNVNYQANASGNYSVKIKDANNCYNTSANVAITINPSPQSTINYTSPLSFCFGGAVALMCSVPQTSGITYQWLMNSTPITGATTNTVVAALAGGYAVAVTNIYNCTKVSQPVQVTVFTPVTPPIYVSNDTLSTGAFASYQWYRNGQPISGANAQYYVYTQNGVYYVATQDFNGCYMPSENKSVNNVGINNTPIAEDIHIYPNPASDYIEVNSPVDVDVILRDMNGRVVMSEQSSRKINVRNLSNGIYTIMIADKKGNLLKIDRITKIQ